MKLLAKLTTYFRVSSESDGIVESQGGEARQLQVSTVIHLPSEPKTPESEVAAAQSSQFVASAITTTSTAALPSVQNDIGL